MIGETLIKGKTPGGTIPGERNPEMTGPRSQEPNPEPKWTPLNRPLSRHPPGN